MTCWPRGRGCRARAAARQRRRRARLARRRRQLRPASAPDARFHRGGLRAAARRWCRTLRRASARVLRRLSCSSTATACRPSRAVSSCAIMSRRRLLDIVLGADRERRSSTAPCGLAARLVAGLRRRCWRAAMVAPRAARAGDRCCRSSIASRPLDREALRTRLTSLSRRAGVPVLGVYEWGLGAKTRRANAALVGSGRTRRMLVSDTLLAEYSDDEIEVILAHELGHHVHRDMSTALVARVGADSHRAGPVRCRALRVLWRPLGLLGPSDVAGLPLAAAGWRRADAVLRPRSSTLLSRHARAARRPLRARVDRAPRGVRLARCAGSASQNLAETNPSRFALWLFHTHPPVDAADRRGSARSWSFELRAAAAPELRGSPAGRV